MSMRIDTPDDESAIRQPTDNIPPRDVIRTLWQPAYAGAGWTSVDECGRVIAILEQADSYHTSFHLDVNYPCSTDSI